MCDFTIDNKMNKELRMRYNPDGSILRQAQLRMLEMLQFIDNVCQENDLKYWLESGTLLGAARHGGFIPWDDDADICMPIKDYLRFKEIVLSGISKDYVLQCHETDPNYFGTWGVLRDLHSEMNDGKKRLAGFKYNGLQVDIFPIDNKCNKKLWKFSRQFFAYLVTAPQFEGRFTKYFRWSVPLTYSFFVKVVIPFLRLITAIDENNLFYRYGMFWYRKYPKSVLYPLRRKNFEGFSFNAPNNINEYLIECYGNWHELPSEDKRQTHNFNVVFK